MKPEFLLALDRESVRSYDKDGHLHVATAHISKAMVSPYVGNEIPDWEKLGLDPGKIYHLLRDPKELEKAAPSVAGKPLLIVHKGVSADDHPYEKVIGAIGTDVKFNAPYLDAPLTVWPGEAIDLIESGAQKEISCGYRYRADMTPGTYEGVKFEGVMRDLSFNHVSIVQEGRAGPDVVVGDSMENLNMKPTLLSRKAALVQGALVATLRPKLAADAKIDLTPILKSVTAKNYAASIPAILAGLTKANLATDAEHAGLRSLLDSLKEEKPAEAEGVAPGARKPGEKDEHAVDAEEEPVEGAEAEGEGSDPIAAVKAFLATKLDDEDMKTLDELVAAIPTAGSQHEDEEIGGEDESEEGGEGGASRAQGAPAEAKKASVELKAKDRKKGAMDGMVTQDALNRAIAEATAKERANSRAIEEARRAVRPWVGDLALSFDSAEAVYRHTLKAIGVAGVEKVKDAAALPIILANKPRPSDHLYNTGAADPAYDGAMDSAVGVESFDAMFPEAKRIRAGA